MRLINNNSCSWIVDLVPRKDIKSLTKNQSCDYLIIGAGYTGLSAARKLGEIHPDKKIIIVDAQLAGEGASGRNSGYLVDTTLNDGFTSNKEISGYKKKTDIYKLGIDTVKKFLKKYQIDCDLNECGKYFASSRIDDIKILENFSKILSKLGFKNKILFKDNLTKELGTRFYNVALFTNGGILINPAKLARSMIDTLPDNVDLLENSQLLEWENTKHTIKCKFSNSIITANKVIFCTNGFLNSLGIKKNYNFPIILTASMTRKLTDKEYSLIGKPKEWGVLPVKPMGATVRMTKDKRILIRNTAEILNTYNMKASEVKKRSIIQNKGINKRFPELPDNIIESSWSGVVCRSGNSSQLFDQIENNIYVAGCYNGSGIGLGTLFGEQIALMASNQDSKEISIIKERKKPNWLPPQPFCNMGIYSRLFYERIKASTEV